MMCYCVNGHLLKRAPHWVNEGRSRCGWCGAVVPIRPLTPAEQTDFELKECAKHNMLSVAFIRKSRRVRGYAR